MKSILVVDGSADGRDRLRVALEGPASTVRSAEDASGALAEVRSDPPDLVVACAELVDLDGFALCGHIKMRSWPKDVKVVILDRAASPENAAWAKRARADAHVAWIELDRLLDAVERLL